MHNLFIFLHQIYLEINNWRLIPSDVEIIQLSFIPLNKIFFICNMIILKV